MDYGTRTRSRTTSAEPKPYSSIGYVTNYGTCFAAPVPSTSWPAFTFSGFVQDGKYETMTDVVTKGFHTLRKQGGIINTPMTQVVTQDSDPIVPVHLDMMSSIWGCTPARWYPYNGGGCHGTSNVSRLVGAHGAIAEPVNHLLDLAVTGAWANVSQAEVLAGVCIKEFGKTVEGMAGLLRKVNKILCGRSLRKSWTRHILTELRPSELADLYMNARYNLRPLYYDALGIMEALRRKLNDVPPRYTFRRNLSDTQRVSSTESTVLLANYAWKWELYKRYTATHELSARAGVLTHVEAIQDFQLFGLDQIVESAWDLIPFSFIVDWFFNVGETLSSFAPNVGMKTLASWVVGEITTIQTSTIVGSKFKGGVIGSYNYTADSCYVGGATYHTIKRTKVRIPNYSRPVLPNFRLNLDPLKLLDLGIIILRGRKLASYVKTGT
jgi:hypothetical protein